MGNQSRSRVRRQTAYQMTKNLLIIAELIQHAQHVPAWLHYLHESRRPLKLLLPLEPLQHQR